MAISLSTRRVIRPVAEADRLSCLPLDRAAKIVALGRNITYRLIARFRLLLAYGQSGPTQLRHSVGLKISQLRRYIESPQNEKAARKGRRFSRSDEEVVTKKLVATAK